MFEYKGLANFYPPGTAGEVGIELLERRPIIWLEEALDEGQYYIELKVRKNKPKTKSLKTSIATERFDAFVSDFWSVYPKRRGIHYNKKIANDELNKLSSSEMTSVLIGARNYAKSPAAVDGFAVDAHRWLKRREWESFQDVPTKERNRATL